MRLIFIVSIVLSSFFLIQCSENKHEVSENQLAGMRTTATDFMKELKGVLIEQIQTGGVLQAVSVCSDTAQILTNEFGLSKGLFIRRVSLKNRNTNNYPDDFEKGVLNRFQLLHQNNGLTSEAEYAEITTEDDIKYLRYLKPIVIQAECLNCHGNEFDMMPEVNKLITQKYPDDKAKGYKTGDLRGAVSIKTAIE
jgi:hypothetical protein